MSNPVMNAQDAVSGALAEAYVTMKGNRYHMMQLIDFEGKMEIKTTEVASIGRLGKGNKPNGWKGTWKATVHYNTSIFRKYLYEYKKTGKMPPIEIQTTNEDEGSAAGKQTIVYKGCLLNGGILSKINADEDTLNEELEGTFDDWEMPEEFRLLDGMQ